jgi:hypothetical protein
MSRFVDRVKKQLKKRENLFQSKDQSERSSEKNQRLVRSYHLIQQRKRSQAKDFKEDHTVEAIKKN